jgi:hypothetical protein
MAGQTIIFKMEIYMHGSLPRAASLAVAARPAEPHGLVSHFEGDEMGISKGMGFGFGRESTVELLVGVCRC